MLSLAELTIKLQELKVPSFRAKQILHAVCKEGKLHYEEITVLPKSLRDELQKTVPILSLKPIREQISKDGKTEKVLFELKDSQKIEAVLMRFSDGRLSVCISSQAGCQLGCKFCATGTMKFGRNLTYEEISDQILYFAQKLVKEDKKISNIVYMGMGEPLMNYENVINSTKVINDPLGLNIGARKLTISTSGICEGIEKLALEPLQVNLALSLHAPTQEIREKIMPIARKYNLARLMEAINFYIEKTNRRVSYEYVMLRGINDSEKEAYELANLVKDQLCHVNLIPYNATGINGISGSERENIIKFRNILISAGVNTTIRVTIGQDIDAACGQLANKAKNL